MPNFETDIYSPVLNSGQQHLACTLIGDTSSSMAISIPHLIEALSDFKAALNDNPRARSTVDVCLITFDSSARVAVPFGPVSGFEVPSISASGTTAMHQAIDLALREDRARKDQYAQTGTGHFRSWFFLLTDGYPNDTDNGAFERLLEAQKAGSVTFYGVGIGESFDKKQIASLSINNEVITASRDSFQNAFCWLSSSISKIMQSTPGDVVRIDSPSSYNGLKLEQMSVIS